MATNPPFDMEDQTDEDFFDKLVDDDDEFRPSGPVSQPNSDVSEAFSNLSIKDGGVVGKGQNISVDVDARSLDASAENKVLPSSSSFDFDSVVDAEVNTNIATDNFTCENVSEAKGNKDLPDSDSGFSSVVAAESISLMSSNSFEFDVLTASHDKRLESEGMVDMFKTKDVGSGGGIKEVGWSSFHADSVAAGGADGFGSYSDFFTDLGGSGVDFPANVEKNLTDESKALLGGAEYSFDRSTTQVDYALFQQGQEQETGVGNEQSDNLADVNSSQSWENLYPGWRYDHNTGQWYQIEGYDANADLLGSSDGVAVNESVGGTDEKSEVSYLQQTAQSVVGTVNETGTTESISNWNQVTEANNGYPEHMVFDPQYPGWYYDMIAQEWRTLDSYTSSTQTTSQTLDQLNENGLISTGTLSHNDSTMYNNYEQVNNYASQGAGSQIQDGHWARPYNDYNTSNMRNMWQPETITNSDGMSAFGGNQQFDVSYGAEVAGNHLMERQSSVNSFTVASSEQMKQSHGVANGSFGIKSFVPIQPSNQTNIEKKDQGHFANDIYGIQKTMAFPQQSFHSGSEFTHAHNIEQSSAGRPAHALVTFGFGGKLIVMKNTSSMTNISYGSQEPVGGSISVLNLMEVVQKNAAGANLGAGTSDYFRALCLQSFPGPLVGGSVGSKELNKWIDERIVSFESSNMDHRKAEALRLLLSLLKVACQHYGKLRSPFGTDVALKEGDSPEVAVAKLFASVKRSNSMQFSDYGGQRQCLQLLPPAGQIQAAAYEVQNLLVSGRKHEALQRAQEGQLWGPALVLASQLGDQFYVDTVKQMALRQLVPGSPLRTLCLLIAGQPAEVFSADSATASNVPHTSNMTPQPAQFGANGMLEDWEENLAVITANRTKDDELVIIHLGDCLWKERSEIIAAHLCYLVAEANFESYSDSARLCLVGADHWKCPRTYACPDAIQRTELYEYAKVLGNSQFILLPFQPYKVIYAHMLAEVGKVSDSLKYCQSLLKSLKTGRAPEVEMWRQVVLSLEDRIRTHQQGGYSANLAPAKLVGKLLNFFDSTAHKVVGTLPPPAPAPTSSQAGFQGNDQLNSQMDQKVSNSLPSMAMSSLMPSASMEPISDWTADTNRTTMPNRSVSEPDFGRSPRQVGSSNEATSDNAQGKASVSGGASRFSRFGFGSQLLQKTVGLVLRPRADKQAKLGEKNKFYYDEKLKRWVEEGAEPPAEEAVPPPPPTAAAFQNGTSDYNLKSALKSEGFIANGSPDSKSPPLSDHHSSGIPPIPPSTNQFSARGRMGVRSRYVDTFNKGGGSPASFQSPTIPAVKPAVAGNPKFFVPAPVTSGEQMMEAIAENSQEDSTSAPSEAPISGMHDQVHSSAPSPSPTPSESSTSSMQRFPSMDNIPRRGSMYNVNSGSFQPSSRRTASWSGSFNDAFSPPKNKSEGKPLGEALGMPPSVFIPSDSTFMRVPANGGSFDELQEVEL